VSATNFGSLRFFVSNSAEVEHYSRKMDYNLSARQRLFVRGNLQYDTTVGAKQYPTSQANSTRYDTTRREFPPAHVWSISDTMVNNLRFGSFGKAMPDRGTTNHDYLAFTTGIPSAQARTALPTLPASSTSRCTTRWTI